MSQTRSPSPTLSPSLQRAIACLGRDEKNAREYEDFEYFRLSRPKHPSEDVIRTKAQRASILLEQIGRLNPWQLESIICRLWGQRQRMRQRIAENGVAPYEGSTRHTYALRAAEEAADERSKA